MAGKPGRGALRGAAGNGRRHARTAIGRAAGRHGGRSDGVGPHGTGLFRTLLHRAAFSAEEGRLRVPLHRTPRWLGHAHARVA
ncbi:hypothetical protein G6F64_015623 [Rhizopus arrhizus]|uniref:Uncharacterized protein n=1 Tax=Rhizopus oryzae TaxID=64495 RepID=A0A9P6WRS6_RHIOR|nr:hypothetical protein G6F64_015623 [Rhizopus arrhizus]